MKRIKHKKLILGIVIAVIVLIAAIPPIVLAVSKAFTAQESVVRTDWATETGSIVGTNEEFGIEYAEAQVGDGLRAMAAHPGRHRRGRFHLL